MMQATNYLEGCKTLLDCLATAYKERGPPIGSTSFLVYLGTRIELDANLALCISDAIITPAVRLDLVATYRLVNHAKLHQMMDVDERIQRCQEYWTVEYGDQVIQGELSSIGKRFIQNELDEAFRKCIRAVSPR